MPPKQSKKRVVQEPERVDDGSEMTLTPQPFVRPSREEVLAELSKKYLPPLHDEHAASCLRRCREGTKKMVNTQMNN